MNGHDPHGRWDQQYRRVADVLYQREATLRDTRDEAEYRPVWGDDWRRIRDHVRRVVDAWPPLTPEQRDHIAMLLRPERNRA